MVDLLTCLAFNRETDFQFIRWEDEKPFDIKAFLSVEDMKIKNHPAFAGDTQNKIDYIDDLVSIYHKYKELEKFGR